MHISTCTPAASTTAPSTRRPGAPIAVTPGIAAAKGSTGWALHSWPTCRLAAPSLPCTITHPSTMATTTIATAASAPAGATTGANHVCFLLATASLHWSAAIAAAIWFWSIGQRMV
jgi:hypothetical protein